MKARALLLTAALLALPLAANARGLVVKPGQSGSYASNLPPGGSWHGPYNDVERLLSGQLKTLGVEYDVIRPDLVNNTIHGKTLTNWLVQGQYPTLAGKVNSYDWIIILGWLQGYNSTSSGFYPDSLTLTAKWPSVPTLFVSWPGVPGPAVMADAARCSTGVASNPGYSATLFGVTEFLAGTDIRWRSFENRTLMVRNSSYNAGGIWRPVVGLSLSSQNTEYLAAAHLRQNPADFDSMVTTQSQSFPDTVAVWARYRSALEPAPLIFCALGQRGAIFPLQRFTHALAMLDSASGGDVFTQEKKLPIKFALQTSRWGGYNKIGYRSNDGTGGSNDYGIMCVSDSCDTSFVKATLDSLQRLRIPMSFGVQTDSMATYATQMEWLRLRYPLAKVFPYNVGGTSTTAAADRVGNANASSSVDTYGAVRARTLVPSGFPTDWDNPDGPASVSDADSMAAACAADTGSVYCNLIRAYAKLRRYFGESRLDYTPAAPLEDWSPLYFSRTRGSVDSLVWVFHLAGVKGIRTSNQSASLTSAFGASGTGAPRGGYTNLRVVDVKFPGRKTVVDRFAFVPSRDLEATPARLNDGTHDIALEFLRGVYDGDWYSAARGPLYTNNHEFMSRTLILEHSAASLGGHGRANPARRAWWDSKWLMNQCRATNRLAGRTIISPGYGDEVVEYVLRSGVR